jgi:hypothetical protein
MISKDAGSLIVVSEKSIGFFFPLSLGRVLIAGLSPRPASSTL